MNEEFISMLADLKSKGVAMRTACIEAGISYVTAWRAKKGKHVVSMQSFVAMRDYYNEKIKELEQE